MKSILHAPSPLPQRWQRAKRRIRIAIVKLQLHHAWLLAKADHAATFPEKKQIWEHAQRMEDRLDFLKRRLRHIEADGQQGNLFSEY